MRSRKHVSAFLLLAVLAACAVWLACSGDDGGIVCDGTTPDATLENIWPNADSTWWTYKTTVHIWDDLQGQPCDSLYETAEEVPPAPSLDEIEDLLDHHAIGDAIETEIAAYRLEFAGDSTTASGATGQNLRESTSSIGGLRAPQRAAGNCDPLLARICTARPDLRAAIERRLGRSLPQVPEAGTAGLLGTTGCLGYTCPLLIHGGVWRKTDEWIGTYGDVDTLLAWKFLDADLSVGHEFIHQLVPSVTDDVFLHCRVIGVTRVRTERCLFKKALDCIYIVDYGIYEVHGPSPDVQGYCRSFDYGRVFYVPDVGPVFAYERMLVSAGEPVGIGIGERFTSLTATGTVSGTD